MPSASAAPASSAAVPFALSREQMLAQAASTAELRLTNLVVFVRFQGDTSDSLNAMLYKPKRSVWTDLEERYNNTVTTASDSTYDCSVDDSFCAYIRAISNGKVEVTNCFPQEFTQDGMSKVAYLDLSLTRAQIGDDDEAVISQVIAAFGDGRLHLPSGTVLDQNEAGVLDNLTIVLQGESETDASSLMRSHKSVSSSAQKLAGMYVRNYNMLCSQTLIESKAGVVAHEFLHTMGLPDLYRVSGEGEPVGVWDIMSSASLFLQYPLAYQRYTQGWIDLPQAAQSGEYTLTAPLDGGGTQGLILRSPLSESEFFVVEYRRANQNSALRGFEQKIPKDGVILYRVNTALDNLTNSAGQDYIYVFRDDETGLTDSYSADKVSNGAALAAGESRGTADFSDTFDQRTIFYSDGTNSGIVVTAEGVQADGTMKVSVQYPDYSSLGLWDKLGGSSVGGAVYGNALAADDNGNLYAACIEPTNSANEALTGRVHLRQWNGSAWQDLGSPGDTCGTELSLACQGGDVYLSFAASNGNSVVSRYHASSWSKVYDAANASCACAQLAADTSSLYLACLSSNSTVLSLAKLNAAKAGFTVLGTLRASYFSTPALTIYDGSPVVVSNDYFSSGAPTLVQAYDAISGQWQTLGSFAKAQSFRAAVSGGKLWVLRKPQEASSALLACWDGSAWGNDVSFTAASNFTQFDLSSYGGAPVLMAAPDNVSKVFVDTDGQFVQRGANVCGAVDACSMLTANGTIYTAVTGSGALKVYAKPAGDLSSEARLAGLSVENAALSPAFSPNVYAYTATLEAAQAVLSASAQDAGAAVTGCGTHPLAYGHNVFTFTVTAADGVTIKTYTVDILRPEHPLSSFRLAPASASIQQGETLTLSLSSVSPANTTTDLSATTYTSSAPGVLAVISAGADSVQVRALAAGSAVLTAKSANGITASCKITVYSLPSAARLSAGFVPAVPTIGLMNGEQTTLTVYADKAAEPVDAALLEFSCSNSLAQVDASGVVHANTEGKSGTVRITAKLKGDPAKRSVSKDLRIIARQAASLTLTATSDISLASAEIDNSAHIVNLDAADALTLSGGYRFNVHAEGFDTDGQTPISVGVKWTISDSSLASVAVDRATGDAVVTVKGRRTGACTLTAKAADLSGTTASFSLYVRDYVPRLEPAAVTLNPQLSAGTEITLLPSYQNEITAVQLLVPTKENGVVVYAPAQTLTLARVETSDTWILNNLDASDLTTPTQLANQTLSARLAVTTEKDTYTLPLRITIRNTLPALTIRQAERFNLFYTDSTARLSVSAKDAQVQHVSFASPTFSGTNDGSVTWVRYTNPASPASSYVSGRPVVKGTLCVSLAGYNWPVTRSYTLATASTRPAYALSASSAVVNTSTASPSSSFTLWDKAVQAPVVLDHPAVLSKASPAGFASLSTVGAQMTLTLAPVNGAYRSGTATLAIQQANWLTPLSYSYKVSVTNKAPAAKVAHTLKLSSVFTETDTYAFAAVTLNQASLALDAAQATLAAVKPNSNTDKLKVWYADGVVYAKVLDTTVVNGTYDFRYMPKLTDGSVLAPVTVSVQVSNAVPALRAQSALTLNLACCNSENPAAPQPSAAVAILVANSRDSLVVAAAQGSQESLRSDARVSLAASDSSAAVRAEAAKLAVVYAAGSVTATVSDAGIKPGTYHYRLPAGYNDGAFVREKGSIPVTVKVVRQTPGVKLSSSQLKLNRSLTGETACATLTSADPRFTVSSVDFSLESSPAEGTIDLQYVAGQILASQTGTTRNATYTINAHATLTENTTGQTVLVPLRLRVSLYSASPAVTLSTQGSVNVLDRTGSQIVYTVKSQNNISGSITSARLVGRDAALFAASLGSNAKGQRTVTVTLRPGETYSTAAAYQYAIEFTYTNIQQTVLSASLRPRITQQGVRLSVSSAAGRVYQSNNARLYQTSVTLTPPGYAQLADVTVSSASSPQLRAILQNFHASLGADGSGRSRADIAFSLSDTSQLKAGNRYTLILELVPAGAASNVKPVQVRYILTVSP